MMQGSSIQATRGSDTESMVRRVKDLLAQGHKFTMIAVEDVPDDWTIASGGGIGGGGAWEYVRERTAKQQLPTIPDVQRAALQALSAHIGKKFDAVVRSEAAGAMVTALAMAAELGVPIVDACKAGRARPEGSQSIQWINDIPTTPIAYASRWGDIVLVEKVVDGYRQEDLGRALAVASGGLVSAATAMAGKDLERGVISGSLSEAILFGRTVREAREQGRDPIEALVEAAKGYKLFQGVVTASEDRGERGFSWSDVEIRGTNEFTGHTYKVYVKNENIVAWLDGSSGCDVAGLHRQSRSEDGRHHQPADARLRMSSTRRSCSWAGRTRRGSGAPPRGSRPSGRGTSGSISTTCRSKSCRRRESSVADVGRYRSSSVAQGPHEEIPAWVSVVAAECLEVRHRRSQGQVRGCDRARPRRSACRGPVRRIRNWRHDERSQLLQTPRRRPSQDGDFDGHDASSAARAGGTRGRISSRARRSPTRCRAPRRSRRW